MILKKSIEEFNRKETKESLIARDADQIALILQLKECGDLGNKYSEEWINFALQRLSYREWEKSFPKELLRQIPAQWWFKEKGDWWINGNNSKT